MGHRVTPEILVCPSDVSATPLDIVDAWVDQSAMRRSRALTRWR